ncbi:MAG: hypothetical protein ACI8RD_006657 [Bacillariaceae sp.]|jgi:hypothetical protein
MGTEAIAIQYNKEGERKNNNSKRRVQQITERKNQR